MMTYDKMNAAKEMLYKQVRYLREVDGMTFLKIAKVTGLKHKERAFVYYQQALIRELEPEHFEESQLNNLTYAEDEKG